MFYHDKGDDPDLVQKNLSKLNPFKTEGFIQPMQVFWWHRLEIF